MEDEVHWLLFRMETVKQSHKNVRIHRDIGTHPPIQTVVEEVGRRICVLSHWRKDHNVMFEVQGRKEQLGTFVNVLEHSLDGVTVTSLEM